MLSRFDETRSLDDAALDRLRRDGDAPERVWALWALALRHAPAPAGADLAAEPTAGVRAHMAVVLAGAGEIDLVAGLARLDPDATVRASAMRLLVRFAAAGRAPWAPVADALARDADDVRLAILDELPPAAPPEVVESASRVLATDSPDALLAAIPFLQRLGVDADAIRRACARLVPAATPDSLRRWLDVVGPAVLGSALADASRIHRLKFLSLVEHPTWDIVEPIHHRDIADRIIASFRDRISEVPPAVRVAWGADFDLWPGLAGWIADAIRALGIGAFDPARIATLRVLVDEMIEQLTTPRQDESYDDDDDDLYEAADSTARVIESYRALRALLG